MISNGIFIYGVLTIGVWVFAHFTYIGTNLYYISEETKLIDSLVETSIQSNKILIPKLKVYKVEEYNKFTSDIYKEIANDTYKNAEKAEVNRWLNILNDSKL